jgi:SAM-dependent methyltransferase
MAESFDVNDNSDVYYSDIYWNDFAVVRERINERISGDPNMQWFEHFARATGRVFRRALILNCGNGWVERGLVEYGLVEEAVGIDYSTKLLETARSAASTSGLPLTYFQANINDGVLPDMEFDLVVNHAAAHHIAAIDRVLREVCRILPQDGWFVSFDYVGPHRNQYRMDAWEEAWWLNRQLPESLRQDMAYPPLPVMLQVDPTEAVHSELIVDTFHRYFAESEFTPLGGAIAYPLLTHNRAMFEADDDERRASWIDRILEADDAFLREHPDASLFAYFAGTPNKSVLRRSDLLAEWEAQEVLRETRVANEGGAYYEQGPLALALVEIEEQKARAAAMQMQLTQLRSELDDIRRSFLYGTTTKLLGSKLLRTIRQNPFVVRLERRLRP